jgi:ADP-ribose pyrophosphatase YjhB (NUDIX family)
MMRRNKPVLYAHDNVLADPNKMQCAIEDSYKYCPHCAAANLNVGAIPFKCATCGFSTFFGPVAAVGGLVVNQDGLLLLVRRARDPGQGKWGLPGGFVDRGETVEQALEREVMEETGLRICESDYLMTYPNQYNYHGVVSPVVDFFFVCQVEAADEIEIARDELEFFEWTLPSPEHLSNMAFDSNRRAIERWMSTIKK